MQMRERLEVKWIHRFVVIFTKNVFIIINKADLLATFVASWVLIVPWESTCTTYYI